MALIGIFSRDRALRETLAASLLGRHDAARVASWSGYRHLVRERPITVSVVDLDSFPKGVDELRAFRVDFPFQGLVVIARHADDPMRLFRLGQARISELILLSVASLRAEFPRAIARAGMNGCTARVTRALSGRIPGRELAVVREALRCVHHSMGAQAFSNRIGYSRPFLSERLKAYGLPSTGHLLTWVKLLHGGLWLSEPGRTGQSVGRQLEYANGSTFRRALRSYVGAIPTEVKENGGLDLVLRRFLERCDLDDARSSRGISAA